jgi:anti-anti-sigma regulatory factor
LRRATEPISAVVIDFVGVNFVDSQGADQLGDLVELARRDRWSLRLARVRGDVMAVLDADGVIDRLGSDRVHPTMAEAVRAELQAQRASRQGPVDRR